MEITTTGQVVVEVLYIIRVLLLGMEAQVVVEPEAGTLWKPKRIQHQVAVWEE